MGVVRMIDDPAYSIIERLRREQRNALRRTSNATSSAPLPTAQWVRAEYRAEMRQLRRPLRTITARNALEWADRLSSLRNRNPQDGAQHHRNGDMSHRLAVVDVPATDH